MSMRLWLVALAMVGSVAVPLGARCEPASVVAVGAPTVAQAESASVDITSSWVPFAQSGRFHVLMPRTPSTENSAHGKVETVKWSTDSSDPMHLFELSMSDFGRGAIGSQDVDDFLYAIMSSRAKELGERPTRKRRIEDARLPGCMFRVTANDAEWDFMVRVDGNTVYTLSVCSMPGEGDDGYAQAFFKSFSVSQ